MSFAVKYQIEHAAASGQGIQDGDVLMTNSPKAGVSLTLDSSVVAH